MNISHPYMLHLIWLVLLLLVVAVYGIRKRYRMLASFLKPSLIAVMVPEYSAGRRWTKALLLVVSLFFVVLSLTGPEVGFRWETVEQKGVDIMIALDCSRSMLATDIRPSRLEQAKREIIDLLNMMQSDRAGLVAFAGSAVLQCPLTLDHSAFHIFLKALNPDYLPRGGTDISGAIQTALDGFESDVNSEKAIILITDGENTSGDPMEIVQEATKAGVRIFCIGVGREEGAPVPDGSGGFKKDDQGRIIMSKVDDAALRKIAAMGMGRYVKSVAGDMDLDLIYTQEILKNMERTTIQSGRKKVWENRFQWLLFPAVALLFFELLISEGKPTRKRKIKSVQSNTSRSGAHHARTGSSIDSSVGKSALILLISCLLALTMWSAPGRADAGTYTSVKKGIENFAQGKFEEAKKNFIDAQLKKPEMPELYYNIGSAAYKSGAYDEALNNFTRAMDTEDPELKDKSRFNLGNTKFRMEDFEGAIEAFEGIPAGSKLHKKAADNIAFVKKVMEEKKRQQEQQKKEGDQKKKEDQDAQKDQNTQKNQGEKKKPDEQNQKKDQNQAPNDQSSQEEQQGSGQDKKGQERPQEQQKKEQQKQNQQKEEMQNNGPADQEEKTEGNSSNGHQDKPSQQQNSEEKSDKTDGVDPKNVAAQQAQQQQGYQRLLNRLEDKPGAAMVPVYSGQPVEKDW